MSNKKNERPRSLLLSRIRRSPTKAVVAVKSKPTPVLLHELVPSQITPS